MDPELSEADFDELFAILDTPDSELLAADEARVAAGGRKRGRCKNHRTCRSIKWKTMYRALRRKGMSKKKAAQISNSAHNKWMMGRIKRKRFP